MNFGENLSEILKFFGMTQLEFSKKTGLTQACISQIIANKREPSLKTIILITKTLNVSFERLIK